MQAHCPGLRTPRTVLIVDDDADTAELIRAALEGDGNRVVWSNRGRAGLAAAASLRPDVVVLDLYLPDLDGWDVLRALRDDPATRATPVVILSARPEALSWRERGLVSDLIGKPFSTKDLCQTVRYAAGEPA